MSEQSEQQALLWVFWGGLLVSTGGECLLFAMMEPVGASPPMIAAIVLGSLAVVMFGLSTWVATRKIAGGGVPTALIAWLLLKGLSVLGLVAYQLTANHWMFWPFLGTFVAGMVWWTPNAFLET